VAVKYFAYGLLLSAFVLYALWVHFLAWTHVEKVEQVRTLSAFTRALCRVVKGVGLAIDVLANFTVVMLLCWDWPREWLVSQRFARYLKGEDGWRKRTTAWICTNNLDIFDWTGKHCE
jgi:hypothetical protein